MVTRKLGVTPILISIVFSLIVGTAPVFAQEESERPVPLVYVIQFKGEVEIALTKVLERGYVAAEEAGATYILIEMDTPGGRVDSALEIIEMILDSKIPTAILVTGDATSAGAIISIAASHLFMLEDNLSTIGTAAPVLVGGGESETMEKKALSYVLAKVQSICEQRGFSKEKTQLYLSMVDSDIEIINPKIKDPNNPDYYITEKGKLLTLTAKEALDLDIIKAIVKDREGALRELNLQDAKIVEVQESYLEGLARFFSSSAISSLLLTIGFLGLFVEFRTPGFGIPGIVGILALILFFWGHSIAGLAGWEGLLLFMIGIVLLCIELFMIPGFGLMGIAGILCIFFSLVITLMDYSFTGPTGIPEIATPFDWEKLSTAIIITTSSMLLGACGALVAPFFFPYLARTHYGSFLFLQESEKRSDGYHSAADGLEELMGKRGVAKTNLRPSGIAAIDGKRIDVVSQGGFVEPNSPIEVIRVEGRRIVVRKI